MVRLRRRVSVVAAAVTATLTADFVALAVLPQVGPAPPSARPRALTYLAATSPTAEPVAPLGQMRKPAIFAVADETMPAAAADRVREITGVSVAEVVDAATVKMAGKKVGTLGVDPSTFRAFTPKSTAGSDELWANVAGGDVAVGFRLGKDGGLELGEEVGAGGGDLRVGAYATIGIPAIDAVVSRETGEDLGLPRANAMVISVADKVDLHRLAGKVRDALPKGVRVSVVDASQTPAQSSRGPVLSVAQVDHMINTARSRLGLPYVWGAEGPDTFDCSGLVQWAFGRAGVKMPRVTHQQWRTGWRVPYSKAQRGDLLFWKNDPTNPDYVSHVAIYLGGGKMLHAPRRGDVVRVADVYTRNLAGAVRVSPPVAARVR